MPSTNQPTWLPCVAFITKTFSIHTQQLYDYISMHHYEQLKTNLNIQHDLLVELENFYDHVDQKQCKKSNWNVHNKHVKDDLCRILYIKSIFSSMLNVLVVDLYRILLVLSIYCSIEHQEY